MPSFIFLLSKVSMTENASWHRFYLYVGIIFCWLLYRQFIDLPNTMVDLPNTIVDLPNTMVDLPNTMEFGTDCLGLVIVFNWVLPMYTGFPCLYLSPLLGHSFWHCLRILSIPLGVDCCW